MACEALKITMTALRIVAAVLFISGFVFADDVVLPVDSPTPDTPPEPDQGFVIYLETPEIPAEQVRQYLEGLSECSRMLENGDGVGARRLLTSLARDNPRVDRGLGDELGRRMDATGAILEEKQTVAKTDGELQSSVDKSELSPDEIADAVRKQSENERDKSSASASNDPTSTRLTENYLKDVQAREEIAANDKNYRLLVDQCRDDFIAYIQALPDAGHYRLFLVAAAACRYLFPGTGDSPEIKNALATAQDQIGELEQMLNTAQEASAGSRMMAAAVQMQSAYRLSKDDPRLLAVTLALKKSLLAFILQQEKLRTAMQARDPEACDTLLSAMAREAVDFDPRPVQKFADDLRQKSQFLMTQARSAIEQGNTTGGLEDLQEAAATWPGNPALQGKAMDFVLRQEAKSEALKKFDAYVARGDYLALAGKSEEFAPWLKGDPAREAALRDALQKVRSVDSAIQQASDLQKAGQGAAAWETLAHVADECPDNPRLNELKLAMASSAPDFVHAIDRAEDAEKRNDFGLSLSWYAIAQSYDAKSRLAQDGIDRSVKKIIR